MDTQMAKHRGGATVTRAAAADRAALQRRPGRKRRHRMAATTVAVLLVGLLIGAGYGFVVKSIPYQTPQLTPPRVRLTGQDVGSLATYPKGLREVPVLTWRDVSHRVGNLVTTPLQFATQLAALRRAGFRTISTSTLAAVTAGRKVRLPSRPVLLTFDDGLSTDWTTVDPILQRYGFTAVVFIDPANVALKSPSYFLARAELQAMAASGRWDVGVQLPGAWGPGTSAARAAAQAQSQLQSVIGRAVTTYAWPVSEVRSAQARQAPTVRYRMLKRSFAEVFGRPAGGPANFVLAGSAGGSLPRLNITAAETLPRLSVDLRTGVAGPPPADPLSLPWRGTGGTCLVSGRAVKLTADGFALCAPVANGSQWRDYQVSLGISAPSQVTAIIEMRVGTTGRIEIAIGRAGVSVKQRVGPRWFVLRQVTTAAMAPTDLAGQAPALVGAGRLPVTVRVSGRWLQVHAGSISVRQKLRRRADSGIIAVGVVSPRRHRTVTFSRPAIITASRP